MESKTIVAYRQSSRRPSHRLGDLQLRIMKILWSVGPSSVVDVHNRLEGERLAYTTIATMLRKMEDRGLVCHQEEGRRFIYEAAVTSDEVTRSMADDLVDRVFEGSVTGVVSHLLESRDVSRQELEELDRLIRQRSKKQP